MDLLAPARAVAGLGFGVATTGFRIAAAAPRIAAGLLGLNSDDDHGADDDARFSTSDAAARTAARAGAGTARTPSRDTGNGRAPLTDASARPAKAPPEPTSAAGASGGVAGTMDAPGAAAQAGAPDPTAATSTRRQRPASPNARRTVDVSPVPKAARHTPEITKAEAGEHRAAEREAEANAAEDAVATAGSATPGPSLRIDAPWEGYDKMRAPDIVTKLSASDDAVKAIVRLYEGTHKKRKSILDATGG